MGDGTDSDGGPVENGGTVAEREMGTDSGPADDRGPSGEPAPGTADGSVASDEPATGTTEGSVAADESVDDDGDESDLKRLGKSFALGAVLAGIGAVVFLAVTVMTGSLFVLVGLLPPAMAGYGIRWLVGTDGDLRTGAVALVTGWGALVFSYLLLVGLLALAGEAYPWGPIDALVLLGGAYVAFSRGTGTEPEDEESTLAGAAEAELADDGEDGEDASAEQAGTPLGREEVGERSADRRTQAEEGAGEEGEGAGEEGEGDSEDDEPRSEFVETGFDEDDF